MLALLALGGEGSGYELTKRVGRAIGHVWAPARSQLYALLPRLVADGHVRRPHGPAADAARQAGLHAHRRRPCGPRRLARATSGGGEAEFHLRLFVGSLVPRETLVGHVERFRAATAARLEEYRRIEPRNTREGADRFHWFELHRAIERAEGDVAWADWVLEELERE